MRWRDHLPARCRAAVSMPGPVVCAVLAALQTVWAGYRFGLGNQSIQIAFLHHLRDPALLARDDVISTLSAYPGSVFPLLARLLPATLPLEPVYRGLHFLTAFLTLLAAAQLALGLTGRRRPAWILLALLAAGHHRGLSESGLYALGFTHTGLAVALGVSALALAVRGRALAAFAVAGLLVHVHALHGVFAGLMLAAWALAAGPRLGWRRIGLAALAGVLIAAPALPDLLRSAGGFDAEWIRLLRIRSAHHVFPSAWWQPGDPQFARLAVRVGLAALAWSLRPPRWRREALALVAVPVLLCIAGAAGAEIWPVPFLLRLQPFRSSVFLVVLLLALAAGGLDAAARWTGRARRRAGMFRAAAPLLALILAFIALALPAAEGLGPAALLVGAAVLLRAGRLTPSAATAAALMLAVAALSSARLGIPAFAWPRALLANAAGELPPAAPWLAGALGFLLLERLARARRPWSARAAGALLAAWILWEGAPPADAPGSPAADWADIQRRTERNTPPDALVLTPTVPGGFRIHARRAVVGEWRDGTQQFFDPAFARRWWDRMERIRGEADGGRGRELPDLPDEELLVLAREFGATHVLLPAARAARLVPVDGNARWTLYRAEAPPPPPAPAGFASPEIWAEQERFLREVIQPNIERHRKRDAVLRVRDAAGQPVADARWRVEQAGHRFGFGSALPHFVEPSGPSRGFRPPLVDPRQFPLFLDLFNYSVTSYSGKWDSIEPVRGRPDYRALDAYIAWCRENGVAVEFHFVTGYPPAWLRGLPPETQRAELLRHANALIDRYGDRVAAWQIVNERQLLPFAPDVFRLFRERLPGVPLGVSNCSRFYSERTGEARRMEILNGWKDIEWLRSQGVTVDYFGYHGHRPFPLWADLRVVYEAFDAFQEAGLRVRVTEFGITPDGPIAGTVRRGNWTPELHAEYYRLLYLAAYSHPAVDAINIWGIEPITWMAGAGLLDADYRPKPVYEALRRLIREELHARADGRLPLDGAIRFRGFHGPYRLEIETPGGVARGEFALDAGPAPAEFRVAWMPGAPRLVVEDAAARDAANR